MFAWGYIIIVIIVVNLWMEKKSINLELIIKV